MRGFPPFSWLVLIFATAGFVGCSDGQDAPSDLPQDGTDAPVSSGVRLNEVVAKATGGGPDWVELYNPTAAPIDLAGFSLRDALDSHSFRFPTATTIPPGGFLIVEAEGGTGALVATYGFGSSDEARLFDASDALVDSTSWSKGDAPEGMSWGRSPDGSGAFTTLPLPTQNGPNAAPL